MVVEYEAPGRLRDRVEHGPTARAIKQARDYVEGVARQECQQVHRLIGVVVDGCYFIYVRKAEGHWTDPEVEPVNEQSVARFLRLLVSLTSGKALLPDNLVQDFGSNTIYAQRIASSLYQSISEALDDGQVDVVDKLFEQWQTFFGEVTGYEEGSTPLRNRPELRQFARGMGLDVQTVDPPRLFFTVHTYFALLIKLIAYYALSRFVSGFGTRFGSMHQLGDDDLKREIEELECGGIFRTLGIRNFLEGDFFKWYLHTWNASVANAVRTLLERLKDYDPGTLEVSPEQARDLLKKLYHRLMPREIRHDLGEYYTPDWLAEHVLNELGYEGQTDKRLLDPACGSGTFLVLAIKRLRERCFRGGLNEQETLETILNNVVGIDLNPLAAIAARTNYLLALGDLLVHRTREIDIPVYLADSILTPAAGQQLFNQDRYEINTAVGQFDIPSCLKRQDQINNLCNLLEECVANSVQMPVFVDRARELLRIPKDDWTGRSGGAGAETILRGLYGRLCALHTAGLDGIWPRILQNAFMPLFLGRFEFIAGNPPWVNWERLPEHYKLKIGPIWKRFSLFPHRGFRAILGGAKDDISVIMLYVCLADLCCNDGHLGFLITQSVLKASGGGQGFRRLRLNDTCPLRMVRAEDYSDFQPFEGATNRTAAVYIARGEPTEYPVDYSVWQKTSRGAIGQDATLSEVMGRVRVLPYAAVPVNPDDDTSAWMTGRPEALETLRRLCGSSQYQSRKGVYASVNGVFWVTRIQDRPDGKVIVQNHVAGSRRPIRPATAAVEPDCLYPLLRGRDVARWKAAPSLEIIITHTRESGLNAIPESRLQRNFPGLFKYLKHFEGVQRRSGLFRRYCTRRSGGRTIETGPFYSMFDIGPYTFSPWKVVFREISTGLTAAVVGPADGKPVIPDHKLVLVPADSEEEAHYLAGILNSCTVGFFAASYTIGTQFSTHLFEYVHIPVWNAEDARMRSIARDAREASRCNRETDLPAIEDRLEQHVAGLLGMTDDELRATRTGYMELTKADLRATTGGPDADVETVKGDDEEAPGDGAGVLAALNGNGEMTAAEVAAAAGVDTADLRPLLRQLIEAGRIKQGGRGRGTRYRLAEGGEE